MHTTDRLLLRPMEAAEALGIGRSRIYEMLREGQLPVVRLGKSVRIPADRLRDWIDANTVEPTQDYGQ